MIVGIAVGLGVLLLLALAWARGRRHAIRRVSGVVNRLDERPSEVEHRGGGRLESALSRLERTAERSNERLADTTIERDRLLAALEAIEDGVIVASSLGRVVFRNPVAEQFAGARHGDALVEGTVDEVLSGALAGRASTREVQVFGPPKRSLEVRGVPLADVGGAAVFVRDVSSARRVDSVRRDFVANVSHELKTPIGALTALAGTLADDDEPETMRRLAGRMLHEAERLARIVDDLLDLSLIEGQEAPEREPVPVRLLLEQAVDRVRGVAEAGSVAIHAESPAADMVVLCDRRQLVSALFNLLENAVKYSEPDGEEPARVELGAYEQAGRVVLWVRDHGMGVPTRDRERIFERFYRVDRARSRESGGTGLGLAIVRHVAQAHGGEVRVESAEGEGSTFSLVLPLATTSGSPMVGAAG